VETEETGAASWFFMDNVCCSSQAGRADLERKTTLREGSQPLPSLGFPSRTIPAESLDPAQFPQISRKCSTLKWFVFNKPALSFWTGLLGVQEVPGSNPGGPTS
jgi:hypothetical protein